MGAVDSARRTYDGHGALATLATALVLVATMGVSLAVAGKGPPVSANFSASSGSAARVVYASGFACIDGECSEVLDEAGFGVAEPGNADVGSSNADVSRSDAVDARAAGLQPSGEVAAAGPGSLAFTGYLVAPAIAIALLLVGLGAVLLRSPRRVAD